MAGVARENGQIEHRALAGGMQAYLPVRTDKPLLQQARRDAKRFEQIERRGMKGRGAQILGDRRLGLANTNGNPRARQQQGEAKADWSGAGNENLRVGSRR